MTLKLKRMLDLNLQYRIVQELVMVMVIFLLLGKLVLMPVRIVCAHVGAKVFNYQREKFAL